VKFKSVEEKADHYFQPVGSEESLDIIERGYKILIISKNVAIHQAVQKTLKYFSFSGKRLTVLEAYSLKEAENITIANHELILIVIDNDTIINGAYHNLLTYIEEELNNKVCHITFKQDLIHSPMKCPEKEDQQNDGQEEFEIVREKLVDIIRMIMLTFDRDSKSRQQSQDVDVQEDNTRKDEKNSKTREQLYTILAHDLQVPVGNIKVMLDFLTNDHELLDQKTSEEILMNVRDSANSIHEILENLLFWTRLHKHEINFNPVKFNLAHLVRENITLLKATGNRKKINLSAQVDENIEAFADEYMITTVLRNLMYNAIKFTKQGGKITVGAKEHKDHIKIEVTDTGIGIPKQDIEKLFQPDVYFKTSGTAKESGTGLGLMLCKDFIEKNGGKIKVTSTEGKGSKFCITIPKHRTA